jgi:hypothetical protein
VTGPEFLSRAQEAELDEVRKALGLVTAAADNLHEVCRQVLARRIVTQAQVSEVLGIKPRQLRNRLSQELRAGR